MQQDYNMAMWVFRTAGGGHHGDPQGDGGIGVDLGRLKSKLLSIKPTPLIYDDSKVKNFILDELLTYGRLRQGWGIPDLDLTLPEKVWVENFILGAKKYWNEILTCKSAMGRKKILDHMLNMVENDIIFIPNVSSNSFDARYFTVATISKSYRFDKDRLHHPNTWEKDFGHIIEVKFLKVYRFSDNTLPKNLFGAPFLHAIDPIPKYYVTHKVFQDFIHVQYQIK